MIKGKNTLTFMARMGLKIILLALGISVIFFIPYLPLGLVFSKGIVLTLGATLGLLFYFLDSISIGRFVLPRGNTWKFFFGFVLTSAITSFFVPNPLNSFIGSGFDTMTVSTLAITFVYFFLINVWGNGINFTKYIFKTIFLTGFIAVIFSVAQLIFNIITRFPKFFVELGNSNLVGSFHDLGFLISLFVIFLTISIETNFWRGPMKIISVIGIVMALSILFIINYSLLWYLVGFFGLVLLIIELMPNNKINTINTFNDTVPEPNIGTPYKIRRFCVFAFLLVFCAFIGITGSRSITQFFSSAPVNFSYNEVRPSIGSSLTIIKDTYYNNPLTGAGLNRYNQAWEMGKHKILGGKLISSEYWAASFDNGSSLFMGFIDTLGVVPGILFLIFLYLIIKNILGLFKSDTIHKTRSRDVFVYGFTAVYVLFIFLFDIPNTALFVGIFSIFGLVVSRIQTIKGIVNKEFWFISDSRYSFFAILGTIMAIILLSLVTFIILGSFYAGYLVNRAAYRPATTEGFVAADIDLSKALKIHRLDDYARMNADAHLFSTSNLLKNKDKSQQELSTAVTIELTAAVNNAKLAITLDPKNYQNYMSLLKVQEALVQLGGKDIYVDAISTGNKILTLSPENIGIIFRQAKIATLTENYYDAYSFIDKILEINPYFIDAYILHSQIRVTENDSQRALSELEEAMRLNNNNAALEYQKGLIYASQNNYTSAALQFEKVSQIAPGSMDVYSSLALIYEKLGQRDSVLRVLNTARQYFRDTTQIDALITRVKSGGSIDSSVTISEITDKKINNTITDKNKQTE